MGLLDNPQDAAMMQLGLGLLSAGGPSRMPVSFGQALGSAGNQAMDAYRQAQQAQMMQELRRQQAEHQKIQIQEAQMKMEEMKRQQALKDQMQQAARDSMLSPQQQAVGVGGPTQAAADLIPSLQPRFDSQGFINRMYGIDPLTALKVKDEFTPKPIRLGADESLLMPDANDPRKFTPIATGQGKNEVKNGYLIKDKSGNWVIDPTLFAAEKELKATAAPKVTMSPTIKVGNTFGETVAKSGAEKLMGNVEAASGVPQQMEAAQQVLSAMDTGKVMAGPGTKWGIAAQQIFGGDQEKLNATRLVIQGLAKLSLAGRQSLKGQGTITDYETKLLANATSGDIDDLSTGEIRLIANGAIKNGQYIYSQGQKASSALRKMPEFGSIGAAFELPELPSYTGPKSSISGGGWSAKVIK